MKTFLYIVAVVAFVINCPLLNGQTVQPPDTFLTGTGLTGVAASQFAAASDFLNSQIWFSEETKNKPASLILGYTLAKAPTGSLIKGQELDQGVVSFPAGHYTRRQVLWMVHQQLGVNVSVGNLGVQVEGTTASSSPSPSGSSETH